MAWYEQVFGILALIVIAFWSIVGLVVICVSAECARREEERERSKKQKKCKGIKMLDKRVAMIQDIDYFGIFRGVFVPCIGVANDVNYIYRSSKVTIPFALFEELHASTMALHYSKQRFNAAARKLDDAVHLQRGTVVSDDVSSRDTGLTKNENTI